MSSITNVTSSMIQKKKISGKILAVDIERQLFNSWGKIYVWCPLFVYNAWEQKCFRGNYIHVEVRRKLKTRDRHL